MPLTGSATAGDPATDGAGAEDQALDLLARVAVLSLEGRPPPAELPGEVRAPLPLPAADVLRQLLGHAKTGLPLRVVQRRLAELEDHPPEVTRARRTGQLALMGWFLFMCFGCCLSPFSGTMIRLFPVMGAANIRVDREQDLIEDLDKASLSDYLAAASHPDLLARLRVVPALEADQRVRQKLQDDIEQTRKRMDERAKWEGFFYEMVVAQDHKQREDQRKFVKRYQPPRTGLDPGQLRRDAARQLEAPAQSQGEIGTYLQTLNYAGFFLGPVLWVVWAFLTRGGLSYFAAGIGIVRSDGRPAGRFRCAWRAFLVWIPLGVLVLAAFWLDDWYWSSNWYSSPSGPPLAPVGALWVSWLLGWTAWLLLGAYLILALRYPSRSPLDRLAGTYLVPVR